MHTLKYSFPAQYVSATERHTCAECALICCCSWSCSRSSELRLPGGATMGLLRDTAGLRRLTSFFSTSLSCRAASERMAFSPSRTRWRSNACNRHKRMLHANQGRQATCCKGNTPATTHPQCACRSCPREAMSNSSHRSNNQQLSTLTWSTSLMCELTQLTLLSVHRAVLLMHGIKCIRT